jgi:hypothetical protein
MRIDYLLAPKGALDRLAEGHLESCEYTLSMFGSDHKALKAAFNNKSIVIEKVREGERPLRQTPSKSEPMIDEDNTESDVKDNENMEWALNLVQSLPPPDDEEYITDEPEMIAHRYSKKPKRLLVINHEKMRADIIRDRIKQNSLHELSPSINSLDGSKPSLPVITVPAVSGCDMEPIDALVDSGALGEFMPIAEARRRDLKISPCNTIIGVGDNRTITAVVNTLLRLNSNGHVVERPVFLLQDCPYKLILGCKFFYEYSCDILFSSRCLQMQIPYEGHKETTQIPFRISGTRLLGTCATILPPNTETKVKVNPDPIFHDAAMKEETRWGLVTGVQSDKRLIAHGVARFCDPHNEDYNWVNVINPTDEPVTIEKGEVMAHHAETHLLNMTITKVDTDTMTTDDNGVSLSHEIRNMTVEEVDDAIAKNSHL